MSATTLLNSDGSSGEEKDVGIDWGSDSDEAIDRNNASAFSDRMERHGKPLFQKFRKGTYGLRTPIPFS